ncbi:MAG TPA: 4-(cytidine 5'-diphospho)-2-C-methyl-D-erythritol kinase [Terriglobales bacterium]|jgi:4-diphosphocytidyl-2-C-methyl-D-erythritol kinase|nr:4-(cytidine 5'-diphospho)-2-C-methyl-D-erythritol kinase [Terriglobales bacterium]
MDVTVRSFAKINLGLRIGAFRHDGFHELRTVYQTIALHDIIRVQVGRGSGIEIRCEDPRVPKDDSNTCYRIVDRAMLALQARGRVVIEIEKRLAVQGGLGGASGNAVATLLALERALKRKLPSPERLEIAADVGSDLPLFLVGGTILGVGHGEEVYPLQDLPSIPCVIATPEIGVSTPKAFADWDALIGRDLVVPTGGAVGTKLTLLPASDRISEFGRVLSAWLGGLSQSKNKQDKLKSGRALSGVPVSKGRGRAETLLLDLVRTGIENDFERVVFPKYPELREVKGVLERAGAVYASLSGSGSTIYGLFASREAAVKAAARLREDGTPAVATITLTRQQYWNKIFD